MRMNSMKKWFLNKLQLPKDITMNLPRVTMIGQLHIYIENYKSLLHFTNNEVRIEITEGELLIQGNDLVIKTMLREELLIEGTINHIQFNEQ